MTILNVSVPECSLDSECSSEYGQGFYCDKIHNVIGTCKKEDKKDISDYYIHITVAVAFVLFILIMIFAKWKKKLCFSGDCSYACLAAQQNRTPAAQQIIPTDGVDTSSVITVKKGKELFNG